MATTGRSRAGLSTGCSNVLHIYLILLKLQLFKPVLTIINTYVRD